jgi:hypothetical protein
MALLTGGLSDVKAPLNTSFNYVAMGKGTQNPNMNTLGKGGRECTIDFNIFTQGSQGSKNGLAILDLLLKALVQQPLTLSTTPAQTCCWVDLDNYSEQEENDGLTYHGTARLLFRTQEV